jgi:hypothetical protein
MIGDAYLDTAFVLARSGRTSDATAAAVEALHMYEAKENEPSSRRARRLVEALREPVVRVDDLAAAAFGNAATERRPIGNG